MDWSLENKDGVEVDFEVEYDVDTGEKMIRYTRNGDGYPGSPPSAEITNIKDIEEQLGRELTDAEVESIEEAALEEAGERAISGRDDY